MPFLICNATKWKILYIHIWRDFIGKYCFNSDFHYIFHVSSLLQSILLNFPKRSGILLCRKWKINLKQAFAPCEILGNGCQWKSKFGQALQICLKCPAYQVLGQLKWISCEVQTYTHICINSSIVGHFLLLHNKEKSFLIDPEKVLSDLPYVYMMICTKYICICITHYSDVIMGAMASQITSVTIVYSTVYSGAGPRKHQSSSSLAFVRGIHRWPVNSPHKRPVTRKMFQFDDVIIINHIETWVGICFRIKLRSDKTKVLTKIKPKILIFYFWLI